MNGVSDYEEFSGYDDNDGINNHMGISFETVSWWEKYETLSHMVYRLQEWYSDFISSWFGNNNNNNNIYSNAYSQLTNPPDTSTSNNDIDPYNQIFGL